MVFLIVVVLLAAVVAVVSAPLRARRAGKRPDASEEADVAALEAADLAALQAAKEAKYREIRDAELDYRTGKLSEEDWRALDEQLRGEAVAILRRLDEAR